MNKLSTNFITIAGVVLAFAIPGILIIVVREHYGDNPPPLFLVAIFCIFIVFATIPGIIFMLRKESPTRRFQSYRYGHDAIYDGLVWILFVSTLFLPLASGLVTRLAGCETPVCLPNWLIELSNVPDILVFFFPLILAYVLLLAYRTQYDYDAFAMQLRDFINSDEIHKGRGKKIVQLVVGAAAVLALLFWVLALINFWSA